MLSEPPSAMNERSASSTKIETMRREGHSALVHTAAASNVGQMLNRVCSKDGIQLVNIVRQPEQAELLRTQGARHVVDSSAPTFLADLRAAVSETGATLAFDAIGGGWLPSQILAAMEAAQAAKQTEYSRYGSPKHKQVYIYGGLDLGPTHLTRGDLGLAWGIGGWLVVHSLQKIMRSVAQSGATPERLMTLVAKYFEAEARRGRFRALPYTVASRLVVGACLDR